MFFKLDEAEHVKDVDFLLQLIEETMSFLREKGADVKLVENALYSQISFENNKFSFNLDVSIPLRK